MDIDGSRVIVTGAGSGIGRALALAFARGGARVVCAGRRDAPLHETVEMMMSDGGDGLAVPTDVTRRDDVDRLVALTERHYGGVDLLFNNAGSFQTVGAVWEVDPDAWWQDVTVNLLGPMLCARAVIPQMIRQKQGIIINMNGGNRIPGGTGYACSKVALERFTELLARELERRETGVLCFGMGPGFVRTPMTELQLTSDAGRYWIPSSNEAVQAGRDRSPDDCARATFRLLAIACPQLSGRSFGVGTDFDQVHTSLAAS